MRYRTTSFLVMSSPSLFHDQDQPFVVETLVVVRSKVRPGCLTLAPIHFCGSTLLFNVTYSFYVRLQLPSSGRLVHFDHGALTDARLATILLELAGCHASTDRDLETI